MADAQRVRLHITPFNQDLLDRFVPPTLKPQATNISFHAIETFPEQGFGYVELPAMEAQKLKNKLNGMTLKGTKVKIEEAKPERKRKSLEPLEDESQKSRKKVKKEKRNRVDGVVPGHELAEGRHVKRGWVEDVTKKSKRSKDGLEGKKMRFKTEVPANKVITGEKGRKTKSEGKDKKEKSKRNGKRATLVKEFSKASKPDTTAALRGKGAARYEDGQGWVDEQGNVLEEEPKTTRRTRSSRQTAEIAVPSIVEPEAALITADRESDDSSDENSSSSSSSSSEASTAQDAASTDHDSTLDRHLSLAKTNTATNAAAEETDPHAPHPAAILPSSEAPKDIHPLEALFKRRRPTTSSPQQKRPTPIDTSFSFFQADNASADDSSSAVFSSTAAAADDPPVPQTPHTKQDLEWRSIRSAAPTPDTAAIGKRFHFSLAEDDEDDEEGERDDEEGAEDGEGSPSRPEAGAGAGATREGESEFRKWFYDNRGDLNRAWKRRRREEKKVGRQRENRRLHRRVG